MEEGFFNIYFMIINEKICVKLSKGLKGYLGDKCTTKVGEMIEINVSDLSKGSNMLITAKCEVCDKIKTLKYRYYIENINNGNYFSCSKKCSAQKRINTNVEKYGVENVSQSNKIKDKKKESSIEKYGCINPFQSEDVKDKIKKSNLEKYGCINPSQSDKIKDKIKKSNLEKYGVENPQQNLEIYEKTQKTRLLVKKYKNTELSYQGTYELDFLNKYYDKLKIKKGETIMYNFNNELKAYHPDFYIEDFNLLVEIKSTYIWELLLDKNLAKVEHLNQNNIKYIIIFDKNYDELEKILTQRN